MLTVHIPATENESEVKLKLEHSLVSVSKWEAKYEKPFFGREQKTVDEMLDYFAFMAVGDDTPPKDFFYRLNNEDQAAISEYINSKQTATWFRNQQRPRNDEVVTSELVYFWMISFGIPFECEKWHFSRLMTLIQVCGIKQAKPKKMSRQAQAEQYRMLNAKRREELGTSG